MATQATPAAYLPRSLEHRLEELFRELPAILVVGPRAVGKTTMARRYARTVVHLDRGPEAEAFRADPDAALRELPEPVLLDEWQATPTILGAVKRAVDADPRGGRFLLTGSVRGDLDAATWPGTGRIIRLTLYGLTMREREGRSAEKPLLSRIVERGVEAALSATVQPLDLRDYLGLVLQSGFPDAAVRLSPDARREWLEGYVDQLLTRDAESVDGGRDPERLSRYFTALAAGSAQVVDDVKLAEAARITRKTAASYQQLLKNLFVLEWLPAWSSNRLKRLARSPKRHLVDPALATVALDLWTEADLVLDARMLGPLLESFVLAQIRGDLAGVPRSPKLFHVRERGGRHEVDLLAHGERNRFVAFEVKATAGPTRDDAGHLRWLRDEMGDAFRAGVVLHTGPRSYMLDDRIAAAPVAALWG